MVCSLLDTMQAEKNLNTRGDLVMSGLNPESLTKATASSSSSSLDDDENGRVQWFEQKLEILACTLLISIMSHYQQVSTLSLSLFRSFARSLPTPSSSADLVRDSRSCSKMSSS